MFLEAILARKRQDVKEKKRLISEQELRGRVADMPPPRPFLDAIRHSGRKPALIAEVKLSSPSRGSLCTREKARALPGLYCTGGAACLSVVTDTEFFHGNDDLLGEARESASLPVLRKDFLIDIYQILESRVLGADAVLLIAACLEAGALRDLCHMAWEVGLPAVIEVHEAEEVEVALSCEPKIIGINNRDLSSFAVSLGTTLRLRPLIPDSVIVISESGFETSEQVMKAREAGVDAILVGERLVTAESPLRAIQELYGEERS